MKIESKMSYFRSRIRYLCTAAIISAMYVTLTLLSNVFGLASGVIQCRVSEALCILPCFTSAAIPGLTLGCIIANVITSGNILDIIFGSLATLIGAVGAYLLKQGKLKWISPLPTILANSLIIPFVLKYMFMLDESVIFFVVTIFIGEVISAGILGEILMFFLNKLRLTKTLQKRL